jgi:hypothetical protein
MTFSVLVSDIHTYDFMVRSFIYATVKKELGAEIIGPIYALGTFQVVQTCDAVVIFCEEPVAKVEVLHGRAGMCVVVCMCACARNL